MKKHNVTNVAKAVRGFYDGASAYHELEPGATAEGVPFNEPALASLKSTGEFSLDGATAEPADTGAAADDNSDADGLPETKADLEKLAVAEGIVLADITGTGNRGSVLKADIVKAIEDGRAAKAAAPAGGTEADPLDDMDDATLRETVKVLTGEDAPADADRDALLALARGPAAE